MPFQYCLNTSTIRTTPSLMEKIGVAAEAGYTAVELWNDDLKEYVDGGGTLAEVKQACDDAGLALPDVIHLPRWMDTAEENWQVAWRILDSG